MCGIGDDLIKRRGLEVCGLALLLCLFLVPSALAQRVWHLRVRQTATESLTLIKPSDPDFEGMIDTYYPGLSDEPGYQKSIRPFLVIVRNDTGLSAVAYAITWRLHYANGTVQSLRWVSVNRHLMGRPAMTYLPPGDFRLIAPMFNVTPGEYERYKPADGWYGANSFPQSKGLSSVDVSVDGVVYSDGTFIGPDKTRVLQRYVMAEFAERDEILAALSLIHSSAGMSPVTVVEQLENMFEKEFQFSQGAYQHTLLALYVSARGTSAMDLNSILQYRGLAGMEKLLRRFVPAENTNPSAFGREYPNLSRNDPRVFGVPPSRPKEPPPQALPGQGAPAQKQPLTLTLQAPKQPLKAGKPVVLRLIITNTSDHKCHLLISQGSGDVGVIYRVHVLDEKGRPAPPYVPPPPPKGQPPAVAYSVHGTELQPGQRFTDQIDVTDLYDLSQPGKYKMWIAEPYYRGPHTPNGLVKSNTVTVTVVK